ncbi:MAG: alpha/beta hydrolase [Gallionellaceae bacterium CG1_02_56_997]|nr:alpha/beta hydrolase [Gallionella sp.]OIO74657.1 MAG: alpha/beta hydrolase [Gallionellaceae bacterium CG1_02_56_997]HCJ51889.1 alpha/beta hydrolase [Gallionella sp.]
MATQRKITFAGPAGLLEGSLHLPDNTPIAIAVVAHPLPIMGGTMDNKIVTTLTRAFVELGYATLRFNFRGVGESAGSYDEGNGEMLDAMAAADYLRAEFPGLPLVTAGFSFGGYVQARAAEHLHPQQMVLIAPAVGRFAMPSVPANTVLVHGDADEVVELHELLQWARPQQLSVIVVAGAEHFFHGRLIQLRQIVLQQLRGQR